MQTGLLLVDPHTVVRDGIRAFLASRHDLSILGEAGDGIRALELADRLRPRVVVTELTLPRLAGIEVVRRLCESDASVLVLSGCDSRSSVEQALRAGASGYMPKTGDGKELVQAIEVVRDGRRYLSPSVAEQVVDSIAHGPQKGASGLMLLTAREREVLQLVAEGLSSKEIAAELSLSTKTVESHRANLMEKLGIRKVSGLVRFAIRERLVAP